MTRPLSYAHHRIPQVIAPRGWVRIRVDGHDTIVPPAGGRAIVGVQLWGACGVGPRRPLRARLRLVRHKPTGPDQTGIAELAVPRAGRTFAAVYAWTGHVQPDWPLTVELWQDRAVTLINVAVKLDWLASEDDPL